MQSPSASTDKITKPVRQLSESEKSKIPYQKKILSIFKQIGKTFQRLGTKVKHGWLDLTRKIKSFCLSLFKNEKNSFPEDTPSFEKAQKIHETFQKAYSKESCPKIDKKTGYVLSTANQFKHALKLLKQHFPKLYCSSATEEEKADVSQILQTILTGDKSDEAKQFCFQLKEVEQKPPKEISYTFGEGSSVLLYQLETITTKRKGTSLAKHLQNNLNAAVESFTKDSIVRHLNKFQYKDIILPLGFQKEDPQANFFLETVQTQYSEFLIKNPDAVKKIVEANNQSDLLNALAKHGKDIELPYEEPPISSVFPEAMLKKILTNELERSLPANKKDTETVVNHLQEFLNENFLAEHSLEEIAEEIAKKTDFKGSEILDLLQKQWNEESRRIFSRLQEIIKYTRLPNGALEEICRLSGCSEKEVEPLLRIKALEMILVMNQSLQALPTAHAVSFALFEDLSIPPRASDATFRFSDNFSSLTASVNWIFPVINEETHEDTPIGLKAASVMEFPSLVAKEAKDTPVLTLTPLKNLELSWNTTEKFIDHLINDIDHFPDTQKEGLLPTQSEEKELKVEFEEI